MIAFAPALALLLGSPTAEAWQPSNSNGAVWTRQLPWYANAGGSSSFQDQNRVRQLLEASYAEWSAPACSAFQASYQGTTNRSSGDNGDGQTTHGFLPDASVNGWPRTYGDPYSVIGITISRTRGNGRTWEIFEADVSFNEAVWRFVDRSPTSRYEADLGSIAVHEFGHALGLDHSRDPSATMYESYAGGTGGRDISGDDIDGVCTLYPSGAPLPTDDGYEDNDGPGEATPIVCGDTIQATGRDEDWYEIDVSGGSLTADLTLAGVGDLDLMLVFEQGGQYAYTEYASTPGAASERVVGTRLTAATYWLRVLSVEPAEYALTVSCSAQGGGAAGGGSNGATGGTPLGTLEDDAYEQNDSADDLASLTCPGTYDLTAVTQDQDWFSFRVRAAADGSAGSISAELTWSDADADLDLYLFNPDGILQESEREQGTSESVGLDVAPPGFYGVAVNPFVGQSTYRLVLACSANTEADPTPTDTGQITTDSAVGGEGPVVGELEGTGCACGQSSGGLGFLPLVGLVALRRRRRRHAS